MKVDSSHIAEMKHDGADLHVTFNNGATYKYSGVPLAKFREMQNADSQGKFLHEHIKPNFPSLLVKKKDKK